MNNKEVQQLKTTLNKPVKEVVSENIMFIWTMLFITMVPNLVVSTLLQSLPDTIYIAGTGVASILSVVLGVTTSRAMYRVINADVNGSLNILHKYLGVEIVNYYNQLIQSIDNVKKVTYNH